MFKTEALKELAGEPVIVTFVHGVQTTRAIRGKRPGEVITVQGVGTACSIWKDSEYSKHREFDPILQGISVVHQNDQYEKDRGRRVSLASALKGVDREVRRQVWTDYDAAIAFSRSQSAKSKLDE